MSRTDWAVQAGRFRARVIAPDEIDDRLRALLIDLRVRGTSGVAGHLQVAANAPGGYLLSADGRMWNDVVAEADVADQVVRMLLQAALDEDSSLVHIHAGAIANGDRTAIVAGEPGSGKSSAIATLVRAGWTYVTDELLAISRDGQRVGGFPKPISLISGSFDAFRHLDPQRTGHGDSSGETWQIPASSLGTVATQGFRTPTVIVFIAFRPNAALRLLPVPPLEAAGRLLGDSPDAIARGHDGADAIVSLALSVASVEVEYSDREELVTALLGLLRNPPTTVPVDPVVFEGDHTSDRTPPPSPDSIDTAACYAIVDGVSVWIVDDRAVAFIHRTGLAVGVDATSAAWLQLLEAPSSLDQLIREVAAASETDLDVVRSTARRAAHQLWRAGVIGPVEDS